MEFHDSNNGSNCNNNDMYMWECQGEDLFQSRDPPDDALFSFWDDINQEDDNLLYLLGDQTPIRECRDLSYNVSGSSRKAVECEDSSLAKRRRVLQFSSDEYESGGNENGQTTSIDVASKVMESSFSSYSSEERSQWDTQESSGSREFCEIAPTVESAENDVAKETTNLATLKIFKGKKLFFKTPKKLTTSIAYPFTLIKPCGEQGNLTLKDINQFIHCPPPSKSNDKMDDEPYVTSTFSGKPVVGKTKIRTEGGKGCITIVRTKG